MTEDTQLSLPFARISGKEVTVDFSGEQVTSDAGVLLLREVAERTKLVDYLVNAIRDSRHPGYITHSLRDLLTQRLFQIACGYEDASMQILSVLTLHSKLPVTGFPRRKTWPVSPPSPGWRMRLLPKTFAGWEMLWWTILSLPTRLRPSISFLTWTTLKTKPMASNNSHFSMAITTGSALSQWLSSKGRAADSSPPFSVRVNGPPVRKSAPFSNGSSPVSVTPGRRSLSLCGRFPLCRSGGVLLVRCAPHILSFRTHR